MASPNERGECTISISYHVLSFSQQNYNYLHEVFFFCCFCFPQVLELLTSGHDSEVGKSWRIPKFTSDELDDYSMVFGYDVPSDISLEDFL